MIFKYIFTFFALTLTCYLQARLFTYLPDPGDSIRKVTECDLFDDLIPADEMYGQWDTSIVHFYGETGTTAIAKSKIRLVFNRSCDFVFPVENGKITSEFGRRWRRMHKGIDIDLETGTPVYSAFEGKIRYAKYNSSYGNAIVVRHPNGLETYYAHLSQINVKPGDYVQAGDIIGLGGNTGRSYGSHLHFEVRFLGVAINPLSIITTENNQLLSDNILIYTHKDKLKLEALEKYHTVKPGETLSKIAEIYCIPVNKLAHMNGISENKPLLIDTKVRIE
jgi:murein DD-endopeptidase MepM/ murein hydrolase activator NlpD